MNTIDNYKPQRRRLTYGHTHHLYNGAKGLLNKYKDKIEPQHVSPLERFTTTPPRERETFVKNYRAIEDLINMLSERFEEVNPFELDPNDAYDALMGAWFSCSDEDRLRFFSALLRKFDIITEMKNLRTSQ